MEAHLKLVRFGYDPEATLGRLYYPDGRSKFVYTLEPPWRGNEPFESCIPEGLYRITRDTFRGELNFRLHGVLDRTDIEIHFGNWPRDTKGCPLVGQAVRGDVENGWRLFDSIPALRAVLAMTQVDDGTIVVTSDTGRPG